MDNGSVNLCMIVNVNIFVMSVRDDLDGEVS